MIVAVTVGSDSGVLSDQVDLQLDGQYMISDILEYFDQMALLKKQKDSIVVKKGNTTLKNNMTVGQLVGHGQAALKLNFQVASVQIPPPIQAPPQIQQLPVNHMYSVRSGVPNLPIDQSAAIDIPSGQGVAINFLGPPPQGAATNFPPTHPFVTSNTGLPMAPPVSNPFSNAPSSQYPSVGQFNVQIPQMPSYPSNPNQVQAPNENQVILFCIIQQGSKQYNIEIPVFKYARFIDIQKKLYDAINASGKYEQLWGQKEDIIIFWRSQLKVRFKKVDQPFNIIPGLINKDNRIVLKIRRQYEGGSS